jgi:hypothetical protein
MLIFVDRKAWMKAHNKGIAIEGMDAPATCTYMSI